MKKRVRCKECGGRGYRVQMRCSPLTVPWDELYPCRACKTSGSIMVEKRERVGRRGLVATFLVVIIVIAFFFLTGCATAPQRSSSGLIVGIARLPVAVVAGIAEVATGYDFNVSSDQASVRIRGYCSQKYGGDRSDYSACVNGAFGGYGDSNRGGSGRYRRSLCDRFSGLARGRCQRTEAIEADGEQFGASVGAGGSVPLVPSP